MKKLLLPVLIAVLAGVGGGSGFAYMRASKAFVADSVQRADSLKAHPPAAYDSSAHGDSASHAETHDSLPVVEPLPPTPADSIRAVEAARASLHEVTKGLPNATPNATPNTTPNTTPSTVTHAEPAHEVAKGAPAKTGVTKAVPANVAKVETGKLGTSTAAVANLVRDARNEAINTALPQQRLAKIFAAMSAKDAAKVMDQMSEVDAREILSLMNARSAAAVLAQFTAARAAAITKGATRAAGTTP